jgi:acetyl-CoA C-acetyltransferase
MTDAVIVSTARTPIGKAYRGGFNDTSGADLAAHAIRNALARAKVDGGEIEDVIRAAPCRKGRPASMSRAAPRSSPGSR